MEMPLLIIVLAIALLYFSNSIIAYFTKRANRSKIYRNNIYNHYYIKSKEFYNYLYGAIPQVIAFYDMDVVKVMEHLDAIPNNIKKFYQYNEYNSQEQKVLATNSFIILKDEILLEISESQVEILYQTEQQDKVNELVAQLKAFKIEPNEGIFEMYIIVSDQGGLELKRLNINNTELDIAKYYNDDFLPVAETIEDTLNTVAEKGIVLLHGIPGTGKTTYLRHLIGKLKKKVLFVSPSVAEQITNPTFIDLLIDNPNSVLIIEDAEQIILDRKYNNHSPVSNLLNISDGLLSDCLSVQIICTFNNSLSVIDDALLRKGRLIAEYKFDRLTVDKAQALANHLSIDINVEQPMTLAELTNHNKDRFKSQDNDGSKIGFAKWE